MMDKGDVKQRAELAKAKVNAEALIDALYSTNDQEVLRKRRYTFDDVIEMVAYVILAFKSRK
jgi:threonine dehydrogenase-like Zn-dependent dehydrogenase